MAFERKANTTSKKLFLLVKSLSQSEKRFFKIYSSRHVEKRDNAYVLLFDLLVKQTKFNDEEIKNKLKIKGITFYSDLKNYLFEFAGHSFS